MQILWSCFKTKKSFKDAHCICTVHEVKEFKCLQCDFEAKSRHYLRNHIQFIHERLSCKKYKCDHCDHESTKKIHLQEHTKSIHEGRTFPCPQCDFKAKHKQNLERHIANIHEKRKFQCPLWNIKLTVKSNLKVQAIHKSIKFQCKCK